MGRSRFGERTRLGRPLVGVGGGVVGDAVGGAVGGAAGLVGLVVVAGVVEVAAVVAAAAGVAVVGGVGVGAADVGGLVDVDAGGVVAGAAVAVDAGAAGAVAVVHAAAVGCGGSPLGNGFEVDSSLKGPSAAPAAPTRVSSGHWSSLPAYVRCTGRTLYLSTATNKTAIANIGGEGNGPIVAPKHEITQTDRRKNNQTIEQTSKHS